MTIIHLIRVIFYVVGLMNKCRSIWSIILLTNTVLMLTPRW